MATTLLTGWQKLNNAWKVFVIILIVNILQAALSPLMSDEPYYYLYAQYPSWGYFDHPPMIAFLIKLGTLILPGELGFRLFFVLAGSFTCYYIYRLIEGETDKPVNFVLAALLIFSSVNINVYSFVAFPDTPLLCFTALFLFCYRKFLQQDTLLNIAVLGVVTALLLYSKYHGVLVVGFTVLSNFGLFKKRSFYMVMIITIALMSPLIYWQIQNNFPTIHFQLFERNKVIGWSEPMYVPKQLLISGPVILMLFSILYKTKNQFQKSLKFIVIGVFAFFFYSSFKGFVNLNWTLIAWPAMLCLAYLYIIDLKKYRLYINGLLSISLIVVIVLRLNFVFVFFTVFDNGRNPKVMTDMLKTKSKGYPLVFENMYHEPAYFMFYQQQKVYAVNNMLFKKTQFNFLPQLEKEFQGKTVCYVSMAPIDSLSEKIIIPKGMAYYITYIPKFTSFSNLDVKADDLKVLKQGSNNIIKLSLDSKLDSQSIQHFKQKGGYIALNLMSREVEDDKVFTYRYDKPIDVSGKSQLTFNITPLIKKGHYRGTFSAMTNDTFFAGFNSYVYNIEIK